MEIEKTTEEDKALIESLSEAASSLRSLAQQAVVIYENEVSNIIQSKCTDTKEIEQTLEKMLDFCFDPSMLLVFKKLCRYYFEINRHATATYIMYYQELWDSEDNEPADADNLTSHE